MFHNATSFAAQNLCAWGDRLNQSTNKDMRQLVFLGSACPNQTDRLPGALQSHQRSQVELERKTVMGDNQCCIGWLASWLGVVFCHS